MMLFSLKYILKSQLNIILLSRPLEATHHCSNLHDYTYKVPAHYCIMTRLLGATGIILLSKSYFQILCFEQTGLTRRHQSL